MNWTKNNIYQLCRLTLVILALFLANPSLSLAIPGLSLLVPSQSHDIPLCSLIRPLSVCFCFKGMVHLIYKLYLKAVFLSVKFNGAIRFSEKYLVLT